MTMEDKRLSISFDSDVYSVNAVKRAVYELKASNAVMEINTGADDGSINVVISYKGGDIESVNELINDLRESILDHQIRLDIEEEFRPIRQLIVAQAFHPCDNIQEIIENYNL